MQFTPYILAHHREQKTYRDNTDNKSSSIYDFTNNLKKGEFMNTNTNYDCVNNFTAIYLPESDKTFTRSFANIHCSQLMNQIVELYNTQLKFCMGSNCNPEQMEKEAKMTFKDVTITRKFEDKTVEFSFQELKNWEYLGVLRCAMGGERKGWDASDMESCMKRSFNHKF